MMKLTLQGKNLDFSPVLSDTVEEMSSSSLSKSFLSEIEGIEFENEVNITNDSLYYSLSEFNEIKNKKRSISVFHLNTASLGLHFDELHTILTNCNTKFDFIGILVKQASNPIPTYKILKATLTMIAILNPPKEGLDFTYQKNLILKLEWISKSMSQTTWNHFLLKYSQKKINLT